MAAVYTSIYIKSTQRGCTCAVCPAHLHCIWWVCVCAMWYNSGYQWVASLPTYNTCFITNLHSDLLYQGCLYAVVTVYHIVLTSACLLCCHLYVIGVLSFSVICIDLLICIHVLHAVSILFFLFWYLCLDVFSKFLLRQSPVAFPTKIEGRKLKARSYSSWWLDMSTVQYCSKIILEVIVGIALTECICWYALKNQTAVPPAHFTSPVVS